MWDRYDLRSDDRDRGESRDRSFGSRGGSNERDCYEDREPRHVFTRDLDLPRGLERRPVAARDRVYEIDGTESRMLGTIGAFRVVSESDLHDLRDESSSPSRSLRHLEDEGLIRRSPLSSDDRAVVLTERGRDLLEANRYERPERTYEPRQTFYAGLRKPRELTHDTKGLSRLPAHRGAAPRPGGSRPARRSRLRAEARLPAFSPRAQPWQEGL
jgi:hypothetical protein